MSAKNATAAEVQELREELARHRAALVELTGVLLPTAAGSALELLSPRGRALLSVTTPTALALWEQEHPTTEFRDVHLQGDPLDEEESVHRQSGWVDAITGLPDPRWGR